MSNLHCKINLIGEKFYYEDIASTNGSWLRLSKEGVPSEEYPLQKKAVIKIGNSAMYEVTNISPNSSERDKHSMCDRISKTQNPDVKDYEYKCIICWDAEKDCLICPCKHNVTCMKCIKSQRFCPICR